MVKETIRIGLLENKIRVGFRAGKFFNSKSKNQNVQKSFVKMDGK